MLHSQNPTTLELQFGQLDITPAVVARLHELEMTVPELFEAVSDHKAGLDGEPAVYCGTYSKYNDGSLCGLWIDLSSFDDYYEFINFCLAIHADEDDPELMFQDFEGFPKDWYREWIGEEIFEKIAEYHDMCELHGAEAIDDYLELHDDLDNFEEDYQGEWDSEEDFARHIVEECYDLSKVMDGLERYFDYEAFAHDLFLWDYTMGANGNVFRNS